MRIFLQRALMFASIALLSATAARAGQLGALVSPGRLAKAHAALEGIRNCGQCHEAGRKVSAARCLSCHKPIADRIARKAGVHRAVTGDCVTCHAEHAGVDAELRRIDTRTFNHAGETGYPLDGLHARTAQTCVACHKTRSFLEARPACSSCHTDAHKGTLGRECTLCHSTKVPFKETSMQFDHDRARFALTGAHRAVACAKCHVSGVFRGLAFDTCSACHREPHRKKLGPSCTSCHTTERWSTSVIDHTKTSFPLAGAHAQVACAKCHQSGSLTKALRFERCSSCHVNVHRESIKEDCRACHTETSFQGAPFDHATRTPFPLVGKHDGLACRQCHTSISAEAVPLARRVVDFGGAKAECAACHQDPHKGAYGRTCDACHRPATFNVSGFKHPRAPEFFADRHAGIACARCHVPVVSVQPARVESLATRSRSPAPSMECAACHADVHLAQVGTSCERCHTVAAAKFAAARFSHDRTVFPLTGKHLAIACAKCHRTEKGAFPAGTGTAMRLRPMATECRVCHQDPHLGQVGTRCETCHPTATFTKLAYKHTGMDDFFGGFHGRFPCRSCHKTERAQFPGGVGLAVRLQVGRTCAACHPGF